MKAIVAVDLNWGIGKEGKLLQVLPEDMKFFKEKTLGKVVVMGRETFQSLPNSSPLKDRVNIVLSRNLDFQNDKVVICRSKKSLFLEIEKYNTEDVFIIGGEAIYSQFLPYCTEAYVTKIENKYEADKFFMDLDDRAEWEVSNISSTKEHNGVKYCFLEYLNKETQTYQPSKIWNKDKSKPVNESA